MNNQTKEMLKLVKYAFHKEITGGDSAFEKLLDFATPYLHRENEKITSMVLDVHFDVKLDEKIVPMSGIAYVASYPEYRGNGAIRQLMTEILQDNYKNGTIISYLSPFSYKFYRKFGYSYLFDHKYYEMKSEIFPKGRNSDDGKMLRQNFEDALSNLTEVHEKADNNGSVVRTKAIWEYYFQYKSKPYFATFVKSDQPQGYVIYEFDGMNFVIRELIALNEEAKQALYDYVSSHLSGFETVKWRATSDERLEFDVNEPSNLTIVQKPDMMARIVNLPKFLELYDVTNLNVAVTDEIIPENNVTIGKTAKKSLTINDFTALMLREKSLILREDF